MLHTTMFLGYASNWLGMYFNLLVWIGALESCGMIDVFVTFIRVVYGKMIYMSVPTHLNTYSMFYYCLQLWIQYLISVAHWSDGLMTSPVTVTLSHGRMICQFHFILFYN